MPRVHSRMAFLTAIGQSAVASERDLPAEFFDGMASTEAEARRMAQRVNRKRREQRNKAKARHGLVGVLGR